MQLITCRSLIDVRIFLFLFLMAMWLVDVWSEIFIINNDSADERGPLTRRHAKRTAVRTIIHVREQFYALFEWEGLGQWIVKCDNDSWY